MPNAPFATSEDVAARWRTLSDAEVGVADILSIDASAMIRERWADVDSRIASGDLLLSSVTRVVASMVKRSMLAGDTAGIESRAQTAGPFSVNDKFSNPTGNLYFTAAEISLFDPEDSRRTVYQAWLA